MKSVLIPILETICPGKVFLQGTFDDNEEYPDSFITFWTQSSDEDAFFDNGENLVFWRYNVIFYSNNPATITTQAAAIRAALKTAGFIPQGRGTDIPSDVPTHTGWAMEFIYPQFF